MSRRESFEVGPGPRIDVESRSGSVDVHARPGSTVVVTIDGPSADDWEVTHFGGAVTVRPGWGWRARSARIVVEVPIGTDVDVRGASTQMSMLGALGATRIRTQSGDIRADTVTEFEANTASGDVRVHTVSGRAVIATVSGDAELTSVTGDLLMSTASGDLKAHHLQGDAHISTTSGDVRVGRFDGSEIAIKSVSGDVQLKLPSGIRVEPDISTLSGRTRLPPPPLAPPLPDADRRTVRILLKTVSGNITIDRA
jgi:Putative adhesin